MSRIAHKGLIVLFLVASFEVTNLGMAAAEPSPPIVTMVQDMTPGPERSVIHEITDVAGVAFFAKYDSASNTFDLWKSDGTTAGTIRVWDGDSVFGLTAVEGTLFFMGADADHGIELWKSDGTETGTVLVRDINPGPGSSITGTVEIAKVSGTLFFSAFDPEHGVELWKSDGTKAGTVLVRDIVPGHADLPLAPGIADSGPRYLTAVGESVFFAASDSIHGRELWKSDGTEAGTVLVKDINAFPTSGFSPSDPSQASNSWPDNLTAVGDTLFFTATEPVHGDELWKSDGTEAGTQVVRDINPGPSFGISEDTRHSSEPRQLVNVEGTLYFTACHPDSGIEVWKSDGTEAGTLLLRDLNSSADCGLFASTPLRLTAVADSLFFVGIDNIHGAELWKSDGTEAGTLLVRDIWPGAEGSFPDYITAVGETVFFRVRLPEYGLELWSSDGTEAGTLVSDINPGPAESSPFELAAVGGTLFFEAEVPTYGRELWKALVPGSGSIPDARDDLAETRRRVPATIDVVANDVDPDGGILALTSYTQPSNGTVDCTNGGVCAYTPKPSQRNASDSFTYTVCDPDGLCDSAIVTVLTRA